MTEIPIVGAKAGEKTSFSRIMVDELFFWNSMLLQRTSSEKLANHNAWNTAIPKYAHENYIRLEDDMWIWRVNQEKKFKDINPENLDSKYYKYSVDFRIPGIPDRMFSKENPEMAIEWRLGEGWCYLPILINPEQEVIVTSLNVFLAEMRSYKRK